MRVFLSTFIPMIPPPILGTVCSIAHCELHGGRIKCMFMPSVFSRIQAGFHPLEMQQLHHLYPITFKSTNPQNT